MIPTQKEMFLYVLKTMADFSEFTRSQAKQEIKKRFKFSEEEESTETSSGVPVYESRVSWAISWLSEAGYISRIRKGTYSLTDYGKKILREKLEVDSFVKRLRADRLQHSNGIVSAIELENPEENEEVSPLERLDSAFSELQEQLSAELMSATMAIEGREGDTFFEKIVTDLLEKMGYGKGTVTPPSNDGGIDGIIKTDPLGFNPIFIQAKRYSPGHQVGRPDIQKFAGALGRVTRGAFITTSTFSQSAVQFSQSYPHADIVLIDGKKLTELMIKYNVGVAVEREISIKRIDNDYFEQ